MGASGDADLGQLSILPLAPGSRQEIIGSLSVGWTVGLQGCPSSSPLWPEEYFSRTSLNIFFVKLERPLHLPQDHVPQILLKVL